MAFGVGERPERSPAAILERVDYPCSREDLVQAAADEESPVDTINFLKALPDRVYRDPDDVMRQFAEADARFGMGNRTEAVRSHRGDIGKETTEPPGGPIGHP